ncbi:hypothetical protein PG616_06765 [Riemerella anatipestifer]|nr:hypothetical protein [Riemerella anatipestifer]
MKRLAILSLVLLASCGSVKKSKSTEKQDLKLTTEEKVKTETSTTSIIDNKEIVNRENLSFNIEPICGHPAIFSFIHNGKEVKGETTGKLTFNNEKKEENKETKKEVKEEKKEEAKVKTQIIYRDKIVNKEVERKNIPLWLYGAIGIGIILLWELLKYAIKSRLKIF